MATLWFVAGLLLPGVALLLAALLRPTGTAGDATIPTPAEAGRRSPIARALAATSSQSVRQLALDLGMDDATVIRHLGALTALDLTRCPARNVAAGSRMYVVRPDHEQGARPARPASTWSTPPRARSRPSLRPEAASRQRMWTGMPSVGG